MSKTIIKANYELISVSFQIAALAQSLQSTLGNSINGYLKQVFSLKKSKGRVPSMCGGCLMMEVSPQKPITTLGARIMTITLYKICKTSNQKCN